MQDPHGSAPAPRNAEFMLSTLAWETASVGDWPQVAVAGRSNVGKSSLINLLLGRRALARTSSTPGRTQTLNFFLVDGRFVLVDLPGYGYAKAPPAVVRRWEARWQDFVRRSQRLCALVLLLDVRRDLTDRDLACVRLAQQAGRELVVVLTKCDKLARGRRAGRVRELAGSLALAPGQLLETSAHSGQGREALWRRLSGLVTAAQGAPDGRVPPAQPLE